MSETSEPKASSEQPIVVWHSASVSQADREKLFGHRGGVIWFTGLSGSGKSTIANRVDQMLHQMQIHTSVLDGDNIRHGLCATPAILSQEYSQAFADRFGLGFPQEDRQENIRRVGAVCELMASAGLIVLTAFVSPYLADRKRVRKHVESQLGAGRFFEVFVDVPLDVCETRDPKGLYKKARAGELKNFTGISDPYEPPDAPELTLRNSDSSIDVVALQVIDALVHHGWITKQS